MADCIQDFAVNSARWLSLEDFEGEVWKDIPEFENYYKASNLGRIKSICRTYVMHSFIGDSTIVVKERIIRQKYAKNGYLISKLSKYGKVYTKYTHRLIISAFTSNPMGLRCVNHINENKLDNRLYNLEYCSHKYNNSYGTKCERLSAARRGEECINRRKVILCYKIDESVIGKKVIVSYNSDISEYEEQIKKYTDLLHIKIDKYINKPYKNTENKAFAKFNKLLNDGKITFWKVFVGESFAAKVLDIKQTAIKNVLLGRRFCTRGLTFKTIEL